MKSRKVLLGVFWDPHDVNEEGVANILTAGRVID